MQCDLVTNSRQARLKAMRPFYALFLVYMVCAYAIENYHPAKDSAMAYVLSVATGISISAMLIAAAVGFSRQRDEFQRKLLMEAMILGLVGMLTITTVWGFLEVHTSVPHLSALFNVPIFLMITAAAKLTLFRTYPMGTD